MDILKKIVAKTLNEIEIRKNRRRGHPARITIGPETAKRALLMYRSAPFTWSTNDFRLNWHENFRQSKQIAEVLVECGYQVEVIDIEDSIFIPKKKYNLFIGHGINAVRIANLLDSGVRKICLSTEQFELVANQKTKKRYQNLNLRRGIQLEVKLTAKIIKNHHYKSYNEIVCFGLQHTVDTFASLNMPVSPFPNYANPHVKLIKSSQKNPLHFMCIVGSRHILKGLDLLLEVFSMLPTLHLHICGRIPKNLKTVFAKELAAKNIHQYGYVEMGGRAFNAICKKTVFYISPSCSEAMQGATLNAMKAGLIPIISKDVGVDLYGSGFRIKDCSIEAILENVEQYVTMPEKKLYALGIRAHTIVKKYYNSEKFKQTWRRIIDVV